MRPDWWSENKAKSIPLVSSLTQKPGMKLISLGREFVAQPTLYNLWCDSELKVKVSVYSFLYYNHMTLDNAPNVHHNLRRYIALYTVKPYFMLTVLQSCYSST